MSHSFQYNNSFLNILKYPDNSSKKKKNFLDHQCANKVEIILRDPTHSITQKQAVKRYQNTSSSQRITATASNKSN